MVDNKDSSYELQDRGGRSAYEEYFAGMDKSMQQKIALTTAHFPTRGRIADMGSGSGRGTFDLACLYAGLELIGVDINPKSVGISNEQYRRPNLSYVTGDISQKVFPTESLDGILNSSVLHHVTTFNDFDVQRVLITLDNQVAQLKTNGVLMIRDFVIPDGPQTAWLDLPLKDGSDSGTPEQRSTAALFELFATQWRSSVNRTAPLPYNRIESQRENFARFELTLRAAAEFVLRKDYRADWDVEVLEEYTYLSQSQFEEAFRNRGLRIVTSMPIWNPWIVKNRFDGKFFLHETTGAPLPFPPTNYLIVGEKIPDGAGVEIVERESRTLAAPKFLQMRAYRHRESGSIYELAERPNETIDLLPWYEVNGQVFVLAKKDFPRPIVNAMPEQPSLDASRLSGYITEPISAIIPTSTDPLQAMEEVLLQRANVRPEEIEDSDAPNLYYTSPGGVNERVTSKRVRIRPRKNASVPLRNYTPFRDAGMVRELDAGQTLRASQVGGMFDARLEINVYLLLRSLKRSAGPWIGAQVSLIQQQSEIKADPSALFPKESAAYEPCDLPDGPQFLTLREGSFAELDINGNAISNAKFEYVAPAHLSSNTVSALPVLQTSHGVYVGVEHRDLPAVQGFTGSSSIVTAPAWRLPLSIRHRGALPDYLRVALKRDFGVQARQIHELGGPYFTTPGVTPEIVHPYAVEIHATTESNLHFVEARTLLNHLDRLQDAHLLISACRFLHAISAL